MSREDDAGGGRGGRKVAVPDQQLVGEKKIPFSRLSLFRGATRRDSSTVKGRYFTGGYVSVSFFLLRFRNVRGLANIAHYKDLVQRSCT